MKSFLSFLRRAVLLGLVAWGPSALRAQTVAIYLKDGQVLQSEGLRLEGGTVFSRVQVQAGSQAEIGSPLASVARIDFPEPPQLKTAGSLLGAGKADEALRQLAPILAYYAPFRDVPGGWWAQLALVQADALGLLGREREAEAVINEVARLATVNPDLMPTVRIKQAAAIERRGDHRKALAALEPIVKDLNTPPTALSEAWLAIGSARLALRDYKDSLLAFLHVPVYTPERGALMSPAILGSAEAYAGLGDEAREQAALQELVAAYPDSPAAAQARPRLQKLTGPALQTADKPEPPKASDKPEPPKAPDKPEQDRSLSRLE